MQQNRHNTIDHNTMQHNITDYNTMQHNRTRLNTTKQEIKTTHIMLNKPVEATSSSTKNSTDKNGKKTLQVYF